MPDEARIVEYSRFLLARKKHLSRMALRGVRHVAAAVTAVQERLGAMETNLRNVDGQCDRALGLIRLTQCVREECSEIGRGKSLAEMIRRRDQLLADWQMARRLFR